MSERAALALAPLALDLRDGQITLGGVELHPVVARDLYQRLGELLAQADRDAEHDAWARLAAQLDDYFRRGRVVQAATCEPSPRSVPALGVVEGPTSAVLRLATYAIATLHRYSDRWEGPAWSLRPSALGHDRRALGGRLRVPLEALEAPVLALPGPAPVIAPAAHPLVVPAAPEWLVDRWTSIRADLARVRGLMPEDKTPVSFEALAKQLRIPRDRLRDLLLLLVEQREARETQVLDPSRNVPTAAYQRVDPVPMRPDPAPKGARTRFGRAPRKAAAPRPAKAKPSKPTEPEIVLLSCRPCGRTVRVPPRTELPPEPRCAVCHAPMARVRRTE